ncbi:3-methyl-2-oxobutanoate hydroxymethyltransferase [Salpingoeca rosetta]|uniref:Pantoate--beta-alanine ligase n=1 Tax=Salpingoeca rosetta (strain ATCC 50818 / BSB-021) TaxID=946362 RepID=F2UAL1_SALR5|nr:3-methyl-2-oxobutanoate hydroxymethyltransferase [Salpingoeca rosetta]EGD73427.1 3-methyl-2-oxobutanoate hydroxymethyltransferase [Salpingoeca rosetta]|eukprot:XP_004993709.1 3-methyl-2-oxobutanoate hydroxymethyltransferase [Salpingoeca rosetta]
MSVVQRGLQVLLRHAASASTSATVLRSPCVARCLSSTCTSLSASSASSASSPYVPANQRTVVTIPSIHAAYAQGTPLSMITAYDYTSARLAAGAGVDMLLVGDSLGQVMLGYDSTTQVTMHEMVHHCAAVTRALDGAPQQAPHRPLVICDLPFGSYTRPDAAVDNGVRCVKEGRADAVKLEGGVHAPAVIDQVTSLVAAGVPVMGHIGLTPQTASAMGGYHVQGRSEAAALKLLEDAMFLQEAGCFAIVLEMVPGKIAEHITQQLSIPTIGIGAGAGSSGQVLVFHDVVGMFDKFVPKFSKQYAQAGAIIADALRSFHADVQAGAFPTKEHTFLIKSAVLSSFREKAPSVAASAVERARAAVNNGSMGHGHGAGKQGRRSYHSSTRGLDSRGSSSSATVDADLAHEDLNVAVIGGGAMGSLLAARLGETLAHRVFLVTSWQDQIHAIERQGGVQLVDGTASPAAATHTDPVTSRAIVLNAETLSGPPMADVAIVMTKSATTPQAARVARRLLRPNGVVVTLQNGVGNHQALSRELPHHAVVAGVTTDGARIERPGRVVHTGRGDTLIAGGGDVHAAQLVTALLSSAGFACKQIDDQRAMNSVVWGKLLINCAINPITAIMDVPNGQLLESSEALSIIEDVVAEVMAVAERKGIVIPFEDPLDQVHTVLRNTAPNFSSMLADVRRGVATEIDYINGHVVKEGKAMRVRTPMNASLLHGVKALSNAKATAASTVALEPVMPQMPPLGHMPIPTVFQQAPTAADRPPLSSSAPATAASALAGDAASASSPLVLHTIEQMRAFRTHLHHQSNSNSTNSNSTNSNSTNSNSTTNSNSNSTSSNSNSGNSNSSNSSNSNSNHNSTTTAATTTNPIHGERVVGFVPTMGCLHQGHLGLVEQSLQECDTTVVSVFVNALQFAAHEDLDTYPRTLEEDVAVLSRMGVHAIFAPSTRVMYPHGPPNARVVIENATRLAEGQSRPHFFDGVATVVAKLFNIVRPAVAYFGQKDAQQCATIRSLVRDLNFDVDLRVLPTAREPDGLAMSSRNVRLPPELRPKAVALSQSLSAARQAYERGERSPPRLKQEALAVLRQVPELAVHYVDVADATTMEPLVDWPIEGDSQRVCISVAATLGGVRLIDNIVL